MSTAPQHRRGLWWRQEGRRQELITPEGVPLAFPQAGAGDRLVAFFIDAALIVGTLLILGLLANFLGGEAGPALFIVALFLLVNFYFMWFEQRWQGRTPGKRVLSLRVVDAHGGQLTVEAVIVRNLTRYVEIFVPLIVLLAPQQIWPSAPPWSWAPATLWLLAFALMPLFNRQRRRVGDLVAGTLVIRTPAARLLADLADARDRGPQPPTAAEPAAPRWTFTTAQLSCYGIYELQVLEEVLRNPNPFGADQAIGRIREKIQAKIGYEGEVGDDLEFLRAFYTAQRAHLERRMLLGDKRRDKHADGEEAPPSDTSVEDRS